MEKKRKRRPARPLPGHNKRNRSPNMALRAKDPELRALAQEESRTAQVSSAVYPSELPLMREACARAGVSVSDVVREALVAVIKAQRVVGPARARA